MIIKVCGITTQQQYDALCEMGIEMIGFNFYPKSKRYIQHKIEKKERAIVRVGVFVQETIENILEIAKQFDLDMIQLHGDESKEFCTKISLQIPVIKVFRVDQNFDFNVTMTFEGVAELFLFDTKTSEYGGSGQSFDWEMMNQYQGKTPYLLSGGISPEHAHSIKGISDPRCKGVDINSRFETLPGIKNLNLIKSFQDKIV